MKEFELGYISPEMRHIGMNVRSVLCYSGGTQKYKDNDTDDWFNEEDEE